VEAAPREEEGSSAAFHAEVGSARTSCELMRRARTLLRTCSTTATAVFAPSSLAAAADGARSMATTYALPHH
jgi:hypothetical protein